MNERKKKSKNVFTYNGYIINHKDYNSKANSVLNYKVIAIVFVILIFILIGIIWRLK